MSHAELILVVAACLSLGFIAGYFFRIIMALARKNYIELEIKKMRIQAEEKASNIIQQAEKKANIRLEDTKIQIQKKEEDIQLRSEAVNRRDIELSDKEHTLKTETEHIQKKVEEIKQIKAQIDDKVTEIEKELERVSSLSKEKAREEIISRIEKDESDSLLGRLRKLERSSEQKIEEKSKEILTSTIQRLATRVGSEILTSHIHIDDTEVKGKIIGKEGRNIKVFERETGVEVLVDESPDSITISSFDPIRRFIAKSSLEALIADGRIQPAKIEKVVADTKESVQKLIKEKGEKAVYEAGILNLDPRITQLLGRLHFRTSFGQDVLQHSLEVSHLAGMLAAEIGANVRISKTAGLLHDIGKALDHEVEGTHVEIGRQVLQRFGVEESVIKAMQAHHEEYPYETLESRIVQAADAISGSRPGARNNSLEFYIKRLQDLENIALLIPGVEKAFALEAGREIRVFVNSNSVSDFEAKNIAKIISKRIEQELKYPGEIKVTVIRETRVIETAR